jgi:DNA polymerase-3 subunit epsilon
MALASLERSQATLDEGIGLDQITFCVLDLETTGGSPTDAAITEVGVVKVRGGERIATFHSLVDPRGPIPRFITHLTGISDRDVAGAPGIEAVVPSLLEFLRGSILVAHNARFDHAFLDAAFAALDYPPLDHTPICTAKLAKRLVWPDVPNVRLDTLAGYFRTSVRPTHRAFDDASATAEVFHGLVELGTRLGIRTLGDLREACRSRGRPNFGKIRLADALPRSGGVYLFRARDGSVLYVGKANDLRSRVRSYFYGDERKKVVRLLEQVSWVEGVACDSELEALVVEARLIRAHEPPFNRRGTSWRRAAYLKLDPDEAWPRIKIVRRPAGAATLLGPFRDRASATLARDAIEQVVALRRCTTSMGRSTRFSPCALADIGRCSAPCDGRIEREAYQAIVREVRAIVDRPDRLLRASMRRLELLAAEERFEEAAQLRDRITALAAAVARARSDRWLASPRLELRDPAGRTIVLDHGALQPRSPLAGAAAAASRTEPIVFPCPPDRIDELDALRTVFRRGGVTVERVAGAVTEPVDGGRIVSDILRATSQARRRPSPRATRGSGAVPA